MWGGRGDIEVEMRPRQHGGNCEICRYMASKYISDLNLCQNKSLLQKSYMLSAFTCYPFDTMFNRSIKMVIP